MHIITRKRRRPKARKTRHPTPPTDYILGKTSVPRRAVPAAVHAWPNTSNGEGFGGIYLLGVCL